MPIVASIGGNTGNQTVALVIRGARLDQLRRTAGVTCCARRCRQPVNGLAWGAVRRPALRCSSTSAPRSALVMTAAVILNLVVGRPSACRAARPSARRTRPAQVPAWSDIRDRCAGLLPVPGAGESVSVKAVLPSGPASRASAPPTFAALKTTAATEGRRERLVHRSFSEGGSAPAPRRARACLGVRGAKPLG